MNEIISKVIPIILLIFFGYVIQYKELLKQSTVNEIKKLVINAFLPCVLFITFINMKFKKDYFLIIVIIFILLLVFYFIGAILNKISFISHPLTPFITTGFCFGLLGIPLYETVFGAENLEKISVLGVGHELFIWIVFFNILRIKFKNEKFSLDIIKGIIKSPIILSIIFGITFNIIGGTVWFHNNMFLKGIYTTMKYLANLATPLILIIIGFGLKLKKKYMKQSIKFILIRMLVIFTVGYTFKYLFIDSIIPADDLFNYAYFTFLILPFPFSLPIFVGEYSTKEITELSNNAVVLNTIVSITIYIIFVFLI
ncbi:AEC family transporter [Clostridium aestuarii]|uniref:AEC family transporter n=1 Tax=Clostridium aestuarii TaxID=338193 RepID=A0ABT4D3M5_9CLOT|nr:AEC family transporter [Clostridium aestuarii]MCY6485838.1 AEC family transporter [Clostridium aestuarii]